jgi:phosphatidylglycerophosphatase A
MDSHLVCVGMGFFFFQFFDIRKFVKIFKHNNKIHQIYTKKKILKIFGNFVSLVK